MSLACRSCGQTDLSIVLSLGSTPLANALRDRAQLDEPEPRYPLDLAVCHRCSLTQIAETVSPAVLFADYPYMSSYSDTMLRHAESMAADLIGRHALGAGSFVVEIGSNDGYLLKHFQRGGVKVLGIDPAQPACAAALADGVPTRQAFFGSALADDLVRAGTRADVIVANNVLAHVPDVNDVVAGIRSLLAPGGILVLETPYVHDLLERLEFDTIYHEHVFYYSLTALDALLARHGLSIVDVERLAVHGGSLRVTAAADGSRPATHAVNARRVDEAAWGVRDPATYRRFATRVGEAVADLRQFLQDRKRTGRRMAAYGAAAKGTTLLSALGIGGEVLDFVVDRSPRKQGRYLPGTRLPIYAPDQLLSAMPDDVLLLTWNLTDEILAQQAEYRRRGGRFIVPIPEVRVV
jgi:SAM-dependent methyltransferase